MTAGQRIKAARKAAGMTQKDLAGKLDIAYQTLAQWENDLRNPKYDTLQRIASALGIHPGELMGLKDYGDNIWGLPDMSQEELEEVRLRVLQIKEDRKELAPLQSKIIKEHYERKRKIEHILFIIESLTDDGLDEVIRIVDVIAGNPKLSTLLQFEPYSQPTATLQSPPAPQEAQQDPLASSEGKDTTPPPDVPEGPLEGG